LKSNGLSRRELFFLGAATIGGSLIVPCRAVAQRFVDPARGRGRNVDETRFVAPASYYEKQAEQKVLCTLCPRACVVAESERGFCGVRENRGGDYYTLVYARPCAIHVDPIEKKPLFHFLPSSRAYSIATAGCNVECKFCQNWNISQFRPEDVRSSYMPPEKIAEAARANGAQSIAYTYSEPVVFYEYMRDCARAGKRKGVRSVMISNGYIQPVPMAELLPDLDAVKIDLKAFTESFYKDYCNGTMAPVLDTLLVLRDSGKWFEIVVLIIPTLNDSVEEIRLMSRWIKNYLGPDVPLHLTRFHNSYKMTNLYPTPVATLEKLRSAAIKEGLNYVYTGNLPGHQGENTYCPKCGKPVIERYGFYVRSMSIEGGKCNQCGQPIAGVWE
jgi:pyruvate formate lyase activating enzyme